MRRLPSRTLLLLAGMAAILGLAALCVGIGTGCTLLVLAAYAVIFLAGLVPAAVDWRDSKLRVAAARRAPPPSAAAGCRALEEKYGGNRVVWLEPQEHRLH